ncbi:hypothetical protein Rhal01_03807 [Rubritalea halochordaticola]|uniref:Lipoprotein n=1 Tax=Rubritalea halochordaticola TaxID=714537 RepID=A0ABP9V4L1_9BACT
MRLVFILSCALLAVGCKSAKTTAPKAVAKAPAEVAELLIELEGATSPVRIEFDSASHKREGSNSFSTSTERPYLACISHCYVGDYSLNSNFTPDETKTGKVIAIQVTKRDPDTKQDIYSKILFCDYQGQEEVIHDANGIKLTIRKPKND